MCESCGCSLTDLEHKHDTTDNKNEIKVLASILEKNEAEAGKIRNHLNDKNIFSANLMSSPGSGKTSLLEKTAELIKLKIGVVEGDLETNKDAERIRAKGVPAYQVATGQTCHLDAFMVHHGIHHLPIDDIEILFVENVGNLVCPATYDLGTDKNIVLLSVPEGDDKVAKYPVMFRSADLLLVTKVDLMEHFDFDMEQVKLDMKKLNPKARIIEISIKDDNSIMEWINYLLSEKNTKFNS